MLRSLHIWNYALISELHIDFPDQLSIITGETGAGKSILLGALGLILGKRSDREVLFDPDKKCIVEGRFDIRRHGLQSFFEAADLDYEDLSILRREINKNGKSRAFINDTPVKLSTLKALGTLLIDLHQQQEQHELGRSDFQLAVIDSLAGHEEELDTYRNLFMRYRSLCRKLEALEKADAEARRDLDYLKFQLQEIEEAAIEDPEEKEALESELKSLTHAESVKSELCRAIEGLSGSETSVDRVLEDVLAALRQAARYHAPLEPLLERLESVSIEASDISRELETLESGVVFDERRIREIEERLNLLNRLEMKHQAGDLRALLEVRDDLENKIRAIGQAEFDLSALRKESEALGRQVQEKARLLSKARLRAAAVFQAEASKLLPEVGMHNGQIEVKWEEMKEAGPNGFDHFTFYFSANKGHELRELGKIASGGERSRVMLIIKSLVAASTALPTLIFDEIDSGISGETARKVGLLMKKLAEKHQVLTITHLPQIAGLGSRHFLVYKETAGKRTLTRIRALSEEERMQEIAKMLSGEDPSEAALENARELLAH